MLCNRGPTVLSIQDADTVKASASGEIKVGTYNFKLTVKDKEELSSSATLTVNVKKGNGLSLFKWTILTVLVLNNKCFVQT